MTNLVQQRTPDDCGICCVAMVMNIDYEHAMQVALKTNSYEAGKGLLCYEQIFTELGLQNRQLNAQPGYNFCVRYSYSKCSPEMLRERAWGRRAIFTVPSLNNEGGFHAVYWDGRQLYDPSPLDTYSDWNQILPRDIVLFNETTVL